MRREHDGNSCMALVLDARRADWVGPAPSSPRAYRRYRRGNRGTGHRRGVVRRALRVASAAAEVRSDVLVDEEAVPTTWSRR
jgi:hypothetical protein